MLAEATKMTVEAKKIGRYRSCFSKFTALVLLASSNTIASGEDSLATTSAGSQCDETKCRAPMPGREESGWFRGYCWAKESNLETNRTDLCAEGYEPWPTVDETTRRPWYLPGDDYVEFTCCPQGYNDTGVAPDIHRNCDSSVCADIATDCQEKTSFGSVAPLLCEKNSRFAYPNFVTLAEGDYIIYNCCETSDDFISGSHYRSAAFYRFLIPSMVISGIFVIPILFLIVSILTSPKARKESFNLYIVYAMIPDLVYNISTVVVHAMFLAGADQHRVKFVRVKERICINGCAMANILISVIICNEVYNLVMSSQRCRTVKPPSRRRVGQKCGAALVISFGIWLVLLFVEFKWLNMYMGYAIVALGFCSMFYVTWAFCRMRKTGMLSIHGRSRDLAVYFGRILLVFYGFWVPATLVAAHYYLRNWSPFNENWALVTASYLLAIQGAASAAMAMTKPAVRKSMVEMKDKTVQRLSVRRVSIWSPPRWSTWNRESQKSGPTPKVEYFQVSGNTSSQGRSQISGLTSSTASGKKVLAILEQGVTAGIITQEQADSLKAIPQNNQPPATKSFQKSLDILVESMKDNDSEEEEAAIKTESEGTSYGAVKGAGIKTESEGTSSDTYKETGIKTESEGASCGADEEIGIKTESEGTSCGAGNT